MGWIVRTEIEKLLVLWCCTMHDQISWPSRGQYQCRKCGRLYAVPWFAQERVPKESRVIPVHAVFNRARTA